EAYVNWIDAKEIFQNRQIQFRNSPNEREWYEAWIWQMDLELTAKPEEIFTWLNRFRDNPSTLSPSSTQVADLIAENIRQRRYPDVYALIRDIQQSNRWRSIIYEGSEAFFICGLAAYQIGNLDFSIELLKKALQGFAPGAANNHKQAVVRCMLGAVEWLNPETRSQAGIDWIRAVEEFRELMLQADRRNDQLGRQWYAERIALLEAALAERLPGGRPQGRKPGSLNPPAPGPTPAPNDDGPIPNPPPSSEPEISPYENLLRMVGRDAATAERLIEYERRSAPNASRDELIQRAIERLLQDRR
ncbi:MAG TPA: hypothetical protein VFY25_07490, partial [Anaerolineales bacterium]|nr:hypothetical protein [Anaerolineales bacterium]